MGDVKIIIDTTGTEWLSNDNLPSAAKNVEPKLPRTAETKQTKKDLFDELFNEMGEKETMAVHDQKGSKLNRIDSKASKSNLFDELCKDMGWQYNKAQTSEDVETVKKDKKRSTTINMDIEAIMKKSVITEDFEKLHSVPQFNVSDKKLRQQRKKEREKTKGKHWYHLPATEVTDEIKNDLEVLKMRSVLDPKHFYKKNDLKVLPKYFQIGKVMDSPLDYYNNRLTKKERKKTLVDELMADAEFNKFNKRKYKEIIKERQKTHYKAYMQAKKLKRKNKK